MKGLLIFLAVVIGLSLYTMSNFNTVADPMDARVLAREGSTDMVQDAAQKETPDAFVAQYKPCLDQRYWLARVAILLDDGTFLKLAQEADDRYANTPLENDPEFGFMIFHLAQMVTVSGKFDQAGLLYEKYCTLFPNGPYFDVAKSGISNLRINHGFNADAP